MMQKLMLLVTMLAMVLVAAIPAVAEVEQPFDQEADSGDVDQSFEITGGGSNGNSCVGVEANVNTGNLQDTIGLLQYESDLEEFEQDEVGSDLTVGSEEGSTTECTQEVNQAAAAG
jgi:hypothetical protein